MTSENEEPEQPTNQDPEAHIETAVLPADVVDALAAAGDGDDGEVDLATALEQAQAEAADNWNKYLRLMAEMDNVRKRHSRELEKARNFGVEGLAEELLSVSDSLEMGLEAADTSTLDALVEGKRATLKQLQAALEKYGVTALDPVGEPFDPALHEALTLQPSATAEPNTVMTVIQRGYQLNGRLLRPARVIVAREPDA
jgi:molecular chaperone GrpE